MALNINGTTGISGVDGSASAASIAGTDANSGLSFASDTVNINTGGTTRATVDSSGRLLLGTTTGGSSTADDLTISNSGNMGITLRSTDSNYCNIFFSDGTSGDDEYRGAIQYYHTSNFMRFLTNASEAMRLNNNGQLLVNRTSLYYSDVRLEVGNDTGNVASFIHGGSGDNYTLIVRNNRASGGTGATQIYFAANGGTNVGTIQSNGSSTTYNTSSDYRLKENVTPISDGITRLKTLKPYRFNFKVDTDTTVDGFLAHEVTAVPEATTGTKDEVDENGDPKYQGIDQSRLVPLLTAALQEAIAKIETLETKVAALEAG